VIIGRSSARRRASSSTNLESLAGAWIRIKRRERTPLKGGGKRRFLAMSEGPQRDQQQSTQESVDEVAILLVAGKWITENKDWIQERLLISDPVGGSTVIKRVINETDQPVEVWKIDLTWFEPPQKMNVGPNSRFDGEMWVPWAPNQSQYRDRHMSIKVGSQIIAYIWQDGHHIRFGVKDQFVPDAPGVPGVSMGGGERVLGIARTPEGVTGFAFGFALGVE